MVGKALVVELPAYICFPFKFTELSPLHLALISHKPGFSCKQMILALIDAGADIDLVVSAYLYLFSVLKRPQTSL